MKLQTFETILEFYDKRYRHSLEKVIDLEISSNEYKKYITLQMSYYVCRNYILSIINEYSVLQRMVYSELNTYIKEVVKQFDHIGFESYEDDYLKLEYTKDKRIKLYCKPFIKKSIRLNTLGKMLLKQASFHLVAEYHPVNSNMYYDSFEEESISFLLDYIEHKG
ncbi:MAG: hypothetical protein RSC93_00345 [Erysipelotrichaceae bacterium]